jgi:acetyl-CoA carboxylase biotin carboxyl carrier protein
MSKNLLGIFDGGDMEGVLALIDKLEQSSFDYLKLEGDGMSIVIGKNGAGDVCDASVAPASTPVKTETPPGAFPAEPAASASGPVPASAEPVREQEGIVVVKSPSYGLFYAQPDPGSPPYVKVGDAVKAGDTIALVEIMKTFNAISAPADGVITGIHVKNQETLEPGQPLVSIKVNQ